MRCHYHSRFFLPLFFRGVDYRFCSNSCCSDENQNKGSIPREPLVVKFVLWLLGHLRKQQEETGAHIALTSDQRRCDCHEVFLSHQTIQNIKSKSERIKELIREYEEFYDGWLQRARAVERDENGATPQMV